MRSLDLKIGLFDNPEEQKQDHYEVNLYSSNIAIIGAALSGKTTLLKTILLRIHQVAKGTGTEEIYILDFKQGLALYEKLPYVIACFDATNEENIRRMFEIINGKFSDNSNKLNGQVYAEVDDRCDLHHVTFIIDGVDKLLSDAKLSLYHEQLQRLARDGIAKGISVVITASETVSGVNKLLPSFNRVIALDLPKEKYTDLFSTKVEKPIVSKGRGVANIDVNAYEFQAYFPYDYTKFAPNEEVVWVEQFVTNFCDVFAFDITQVKKIRSFSGELTADKWTDYANGKSITEPGKLIAGIDYLNFNPVSFDLRTAQAIAIYGKKQFGKTNLLRLILLAIYKMKNVRVVLWDDSRKSLKHEAVASVIDAIRCKHEVIEKANRDEFIEMLNQYFPIPEDIFAMSSYDEMITSIDQDDESMDTDRNSDIRLCPSTLESKSSNTTEKLPFTVFIVHSRHFYSTTPGTEGNQLAARLSVFFSNDVSENTLFVFADAQKLMDNTQLYFNSYISHAFLLNDIVRFVNEKGSRSVFAGEDIADLKERFSKCELGDGYYLDVESEELCKLKFIKAETVDLE